MDGLTALDRIREMEREGQVEKQLVIALTGNAREAQIQQALDAGMDDGQLPKFVTSLVLTLSDDQAISPP
jgi:CheY-like chemotaxis protein